jgi:hypothetical protein
MISHEALGFFTEGAYFRSGTAGVFAFPPTGSADMIRH